MLKPLTTEFKGRTITLECTHKRAFPPPQMYGSTPEDIDNLWRQGRVDQGQYQHLTTWREACGLMIMGPKCLDCPLALKQNPRPGRPNVIETESWLDAKEKVRWEDMKDMKNTKHATTPDDPVVAVETVTEVPPKTGFTKKGAPVPVTVVEPEPEPSLAEVLAAGNTGASTVEIPSEAEGSSNKKKRSSKKRNSKKKDEVAEKSASSDISSERDVAAGAGDSDVPPAEADASADTIPDKKPLESVPGALDDSFLDALADD